MEYKYKIYNDVYYWMLTGGKDVEVRLLNEKSESIKKDDIIIFNNIEKADKYIKVKVLNKKIFDSINDLVDNYDINRIMPNHSMDDINNKLNQVYSEKNFNGKYVAIEFEIVNCDLDIDICQYKEPYIKQLTNDNIINLTGQSGSGKSYYARENFNSDEYEIIDTDDILSDKRFYSSSGLNKKIGEYLREKYNELPTLSEDFDLIYNEIINYCKDINKTIVIDCAQFHCCKDIYILKGKIIIIRTDIDTCYNRAISRWIENHKQNNWDYTEEDLKVYKDRKKKIYLCYKGSNEFIRKIDSL